MNIHHEEEFNLALGRRLMQLRQGRRMSQEDLGARIGVRGQQIHKYETGENRITPERLAACARIFGVSVSYFYGEGEPQDSSQYDRTVMIVAAEISALPADIRQSVYALTKVINKSWEVREELAASDDAGQVA